MPKWSEYKAIAKERGSLAMELFVIETAPTGDMDLLKSTLPDHLAYQANMESAGHLVMAGPVSDPTGEEMQGAGMIIYRAKDMDEAHKLAQGDPMHSTGARTFTVKKWLVNEGRLSFTINLSSQTVDMI